MKRCFICVKGSSLLSQGENGFCGNLKSNSDNPWPCLVSREEEMQDLNRRTNSRMAWLGFLSLGVCLSVAGLQLWHLKTFFERKKLL
jgi:hypothetical protein